MFTYRKPTLEEFDRAYEILGLFIAWDDRAGPCPIHINDDYWFKKLCAMCEWVAVLESDNQQINRTQTAAPVI
jgi:hypothetical protein